MKTIAIAAVFAMLLSTTAQASTFDDVLAGVQGVFGGLLKGVHDSLSTVNDFALSIGFKKFVTVDDPDIPNCYVLSHPPGCENVMR